MGKREQALRVNVRLWLGVLVLLVGLTYGVGVCLCWVLCTYCVVMWSVQFWFKFLLTCRIFPLSKVYLLLRCQVLSPSPLLSATALRSGGAWEASAIGSEWTSLHRFPLRAVSGDWERSIFHQFSVEVSVAFIFIGLNCT